MDLPAFDFDKLVYLDNAATTYPKPVEILEAATLAYERFGVNPGRSGYDLCIAAGDVVVETRRELTRFFGGTEPNRLVFSYNATDALNTIILGILESGDHAISTTIEHNSVIRPLNHVARDRGVAVDFVPVEPNGTVDPERIAAHFRPNTRLVVINHGSNVIGTIQPVGEIGRRCRERGIVLAVDASQTAGIVPIDVQAMGIGALAFTGHKSLLAPTGIGGIYVAEGVDIHTTRFGGTGVQSKDPFHLDNYPYRLESGTPNFLGIAGLHYAQKWIEARTLPGIYRHEMELFARLQEGLAAIDGVTLHGTTSLDDRLPVLSLTIRGMDPADIGMMLDVDFNIASRTGLQCAPLIHQQMGTGERGTVRLSVGPMNKPSDIDAALDAIREISRDHEA